VKRQRAPFLRGLLEDVPPLSLSFISTLRIGLHLQGVRSCTRRGNRPARRIKYKFGPSIKIIYPFCSGYISESENLDPLSVIRSALFKSVLQYNFLN
jgi:hypothetical protein